MSQLADELQQLEEAFADSGLTEDELVEILTADDTPNTDPNATPGERRSEREKLYDAAVMKRVKLGMALLEELHGPDWVEKLDLETLRLVSPDNCVLGQMYGGFREGAGQLWPDAVDIDWRRRDLAYKHGFYEHNAVYYPLQAAWEDALTPLVSKQ